MKQYCLKVGTKYSNKHVYALAESIGDLIVITDDNELSKDFKTIDPMFDKVWNKMMFFNEQLFPDAGIFFDLDIKIYMDIKGVFQPKEHMTMLHTDWEDLSKLKENTIGDIYNYCSINSTVMAWDEHAQRQEVWNQFMKDKNKAFRLFDGIDKYLEHRHMTNISFFPTGLVGSYRCKSDLDYYIMSYDGEGKDAYFNDE